MVYIYSMLNEINNKAYIGKTTNPKNRFAKHISMMKNQNHINPHLNHSYKKYGEESFKFYILLELTDEEDWKKYEKMYIKLFNTLDDNYGYNIQEGGEGGNFKGSKANKKMTLTNQSKVDNVIQIDVNTLKPITVFNSLNEAARETNINLAAISRVCNRKKPSIGGYYWAFEKDYTDYWKPTIDVRCLPFAEIDNDNNIINIYKDSRSFEILTGNSRKNICKSLKNNPNDIITFKDKKYRYISHDEYYNFNPKTCND